MFQGGDGHHKVHLIYFVFSVTSVCADTKDHLVIYVFQITGCFLLTGTPLKNHKYGKKLKYQNWYPPKIHKYGKKLKYQNWYPLKFTSIS